MMRCRYRSAVDDWVKQGSLCEPPQALKSHSLGCASCGALVRDVTYARQIATSLPCVVLDQQQIDEMKFLLMADARQHRSGPLNFQRRQARLIRLSIAAFVASGVAMAGTATVWSWTNAIRKAKSVAIPNEHQPSVQESRPSVVGLSESVGRERASSVLARKPSNELVLAQPSTPGSIEAEVLRNVRVKVRPFEHEKIVSVEPLPNSAEKTDSANVVGRRRTSSDARFGEAWALYRAGRVQDAAIGFDRLLQLGTLDPSREADILYWSAQAHKQSGNIRLSLRRCEALLKRYPGALHAPGAALLLGEAALANGQEALARGYMKLAQMSPYQVVRERAEKALAK